MAHIPGSTLSVDTESVKSANPEAGYSAIESHTDRVIGLTIEAVTTVAKHGSTTIKSKLDGATSCEAAYVTPATVTDVT